MRVAIGMPDGLPEMSDCVDKRGRLTEVGKRELEALERCFRLLASGHNDNTGASCRVNLDGHDCCLTCNSVEAALRGFLEAQ